MFAPNAIRKVAQEDMTAPVVLVVEDDPGLRVLMARALQQNGFAVCQAGSGPELWSVFEKRTVDLVLLDIMLPGKNGIDLCREIARAAACPSSSSAPRATRPIG